MEVSMIAKTVVSVCVGEVTGYELRTVKAGKIVVSVCGGNVTGYELTTVEAWRT